MQASNFQYSSTRRQAKSDWPKCLTPFILGEYLPSDIWDKTRYNNYRYEILNSLVWYYEDFGINNPNVTVENHLTC